MGPAPKERAELTLVRPVHIPERNGLSAYLLVDAGALVPVDELVESADGLHPVIPSATIEHSAKRVSILFILGLKLTTTAKRTSKTF